MRTIRKRRVIMSNQQQLLNAILKSDLSAFIAKVFDTLSPGVPYHHNWHIDAIAYALTRCYRLEEHRLVITQPPRSLKSICTSVAFVAWALGHNPCLSFICVSYSQDLSLDLAHKFRVIVNSEWYRTLFPNVRFTKDTEAYCLTTLGGGRLATSIGGTLTGRGAEIIIVDDPLKAEDAHSEVIRKRVLTWYTDTLLSRFNDPNRSRLILVMQRLHEEDLAGAVTMDWAHLDLPAEAIEDQSVPIGPNRFHHRKAGELLHPERMSQTYLEQVKKEIGSLAFSAQYQQRPVPIEGNLVKRNWFQYFQEPPMIVNRRIVQSWDIAGTLAGDYSVCTTWQVHKQDYYLLHVWRDRLQYPDLKRKVIQLAKQYQANTVLIEKAGLGLSLFDDLRCDASVIKPIGITPKGDKVDRLESVTSMIEAGQVHLQTDAPWLDVLLHELLAFPNGKYDDQVDSVSQFLDWMRKRDPLSSSIPHAPELITLDRPLF